MADELPLLWFLLLLLQLKVAAEPATAITFFSADTEFFSPKTKTDVAVAMQTNSIKIDSHRRIQWTVFDWAQSAVTDSYSGSRIALAP